MAVPTVGDSIEILRFPSGSTVEFLDDGSVMAFLPDGSTKRTWVEWTSRGPEVRTDSFPPLNITIGKSQP